MRLDIRLPIGFMFTSLGLLLAGYGLLGASDIYQKSLGININLYWGLILTGFGVLMLAFGWRKSYAFKPRARNE